LARRFPGAKQDSRRLQSYLVVWRRSLRHCLRLSHKPPSVGAALCEDCNSTHRATAGTSAGMPVNQPYKPANVSSLRYSSHSVCRDTPAALVPSATPAVTIPVPWYKNSASSPSWPAFSFCGWGRTCEPARTLSHLAPRRQMSRAVRRGARRPIVFTRDWGRTAKLRGYRIQDTGYLGTVTLPKRASVCGLICTTSIDPTPYTRRQDYSQGAIEICAKGHRYISFTG
jgi:hypothetical protein